MRVALLAVGLATVLACRPALSLADDGYVHTVEQAEAIAPTATEVRVRLGAADVLRSIVARAPGVETLVIEHPGNKLDPEVLPLLLELPALRSLTLRGDPFLYDEEFATLGKLVCLETLNMHLP